LAQLSDTVVLSFTVPDKTRKKKSKAAAKPAVPAVGTKLKPKEVH
jgi:hypothetical protein